MRIVLIVLVVLVVALGLLRLVPRGLRHGVDGLFAEQAVTLDTVLSLVQQGDIDGSLQYWVPEARTDLQFRYNYAQMQQALPPTPPLEQRTISASSRSLLFGSSTTPTTFQLLREYVYPETTILVFSQFSEVDGASLLNGLSLWSDVERFKAEYAFTLRGKSPAHYLMFLAAIAIPVFCIVTAIVCVKTPIPRRKWLWVIGSLIGFCALSINWTTGEMRFNPLAGYLLGAAVNSSFPGIGPWIITVSLPIVAIIFWFKRGRWIEMHRIASYVAEQTVDQ